jgi:uncharacterized membrane protein YjjP (DUF1212 family)
MQSSPGTITLWLRLTLTAMTAFWLVFLATQLTTPSLSLVGICPALAVLLPAGLLLNAVPDLLGRGFGLSSQRSAQVYAAWLALFWAILLVTLRAQSLLAAAIFTALYLLPGYLVIAVQARRIYEKAKRAASTIQPQRYLLGDDGELIPAEQE